MRICLLSITASHYRSGIYSAMDKQMHCDFIFGKDNTTVKRMNTSILRKSLDLPNRRIGKTKWYYQSGLLSRIKDYDVIINDLGIYCITSWIFIILSKFRKQKIYNWDHGYYGKESYIRTLIKRIYFGLVDGSLIYGEYAIRLMKEKKFNDKKLHVIHNSLDYDNQLAIRKQLQKTDIYNNHFKNCNPVLIFIGRLTPIKKLDQLLLALSILKNQGLPYNLVYVGDGQERKRLEHLVQDLQLSSQVWFYDACYDDKTNAVLLYNADLCVAPGNIGLTAIHAMMFGCPCVSHNDLPWQMPEFEAIKEWKTGLFFDRDNVESLSNTIEKWFSINASLREEIRNNCYREIDENWNPHKQVEIIKSVIYE